jgi:hypothetical protein
MDPVTGLSLGRIGIGVVSIGSPALAARMFGLDAAANPQLPAMTRLFGVREIALGAATLTARGPARRSLVLTGVAVDAGDAASGIVGVGNQEIGKLSGGMLTVTALGAVATGVAALALGRARDTAGAES